MRADGGVYVSEEFAGRVLRVGGASPGGLDSRYPLVGAALGAAGAVIAARVGRGRRGIYLTRSHSYGYSDNS